ncbi:MAG: phosphatase PAP2 family protein [Patescibacteria group bacterium]
MMPFDEGVVRFLFGLTERNFLFRELVVFCARLLPYFIGAGFLILLRQVAARRRAIFIFFIALLSIVVSRGLITEIIHYFFDHARPFVTLGLTPLVVASGPSFPSGHAAAFFALATIAFMFGKRWGIVFLSLAALNALARVAAGAHWPSDIIAGIVVGVSSGLFVRWLLRREERALAETNSGVAVI